MPAALSRLPSVDRALAWPALRALAESHGRTLVLEALRATLASLRQPVTSAPAGVRQPVTSALAGECRPDSTAALADAATLQTHISAQVAAQVHAWLQPSLRPVFNLTGTVLHTNLGRAPLPDVALQAMLAVAGGACNLEFELDGAGRGDRDSHVEALLRRLTGAQAATVVNNNAAALVLLLAALAAGKEVIVSRGELVEIGGAFRLPDILQAAGCTLREVGTTNRTHLHDHADAIGPRTALLLKVHTSNYRIVGFTAAADEAALAELAHQHGLPLAIDLGAGALVDLAGYGLPHEPMPSEALAAGADLVTFSGDKLLGGPQVGIVVGRADLIAKLKKHPLKRALRCDKLTLAALEAVLRLYLQPEHLARSLPTLRLLTRPAAEIAALAAQLQPVLAAWAGAGGLMDVVVDVVAVRSQIGSGALPVDHLPSHALRLTPCAATPGRARDAGRQLHALAARLRSLPRPVLGRLQDGALLLDLRCLLDATAFAAQLQPAGGAAEAST